ncbi:MAG TPA: hypothetical protein VHY20_12300 [Pirellulales bacterium]|nr:hypothetical protein [Pirellulales bacterium]
MIVMIHAFRLLGRLAGPKWSALALGLPSTTAIVLVVSGYEQGIAAATEMAGSSLLGLAAAVALPLAYAQAARLGGRLPAALAAAVSGYLVVAATLGCMPASGVFPRLGIALFAIVSAACWTRNLPIPEENHAGAALSPWQAMGVRTTIPAVYVVVFAIVERIAGPGWAGLVSTFPSMSLVVLAVTHLEAGSAEASRIARVLPLGNTSTLAFLAVFQVMSTKIGLAGAIIAGYAAAMTALLLIERSDRLRGLIRLAAANAAEIGRSQVVPTWLAIQAECRQVAFTLSTQRPRPPRYLVHRRPRHRGRFAPRVETLAW